MSDQGRIYPNYGPLMKRNEDLKFSPIPEEEEREMFRKAKAGDAAIRETLITRHMLFVMKQGRRFGAQLPPDETSSAANLALMKAFDRFDPDRIPPVSFRSFLIPYIRAAIAHCWREHEAVDYKHSKPPPPTDENTKTEAGINTVTMPDVDRADHEEFLHQQILELSETLDERERAVVHLHYVDCLDLAEVGRRMKLSRQRIHQIHKSILASLRKKLEARGITSSQ